jgi:hypothetical protein
MALNIKTVPTLILLAAQTCFIGQAFANGIFRLQSDTYLSREKADDLTSESPLYEQFTAAYLDEERAKQFDFNFSYYYDFEKKNYNFNIHELEGRFAFNDKRGHFSLGRSFQTYHLISSSVVDSVTVDYSFLQNRLRVGSLLGFVRRLEVDDGSQSARLANVFADYDTDEVFPWHWGVRLETRDYSNNDRSIQNWGKLSLRKELAVQLHPEIIAVNEQNLQLTDSYRQEFGVNIYPSIQSMYGIRVHYYNMNSTEGFEDPIYTVFADGRLTEYSLLSAYSWGSWYTGLDFGYDEYLRSQNALSTGNRAEWTLRYASDRLSVENAVFNIVSYGGWATGHRTSAQYPLPKHMQLEVSSENVRYSKITSEKNTASSTRAGVKISMGNTNLWLAQELRSNNFFSQDLRFLAQLTIYDWREL